VRATLCVVDIPTLIRRNDASELGGWVLLVPAPGEPSGAVHAGSKRSVMCVCAGLTLANLLPSRGACKDQIESEQRTAHALFRFIIVNQITLTQLRLSVTLRCRSHHPDACHAHRYTHDTRGGTSRTHPPSSLALLNRIKVGMATPQKDAPTAISGGGCYHGNYWQLFCCKQA